MFGLTTMRNLLFHGRLRRREPDLVNDRIQVVVVFLNNLGVTEGALKSLVNELNWLDGVVERDSEGAVEEVASNGHLRVLVSEEFTGEAMKCIRKSPLVRSSMQHGHAHKIWLKNQFPDKFEGHHYCTNCSSELEEEGAFCTNNGCYLAVQNVRAKIQQDVKANLVEEIKPAFLSKKKESGDGKYYCGCHCEPFFLNSDEEDCDEEVECPDCGDYCSRYAVDDDF